MSVENMVKPSPAKVYRKPSVPVHMGIAMLILGAAVSPFLVKHLFRHVVPPYAGEASLEARLSYALLWLAPVGIFMWLCNEFVALVRIMDLNVSCHPVDNTADESYMLRKARAASRNTLEQLVVFVLAMVCLLPIVPAKDTHLLAAYTIVWVLGRALYMVGYIATEDLRIGGLMMAHFWNNMIVLCLVIWAGIMPQFSGGPTLTIHDVTGNWLHN